MIGKFKNLYILLSAGILIHLVNGTMNCWGVIKTYVASHYHSRDPANQLSDLYPGLALMNLIEGLGQTITSTLLKTFNHRIILGLATLIIVSGTGLAIYMPTVSGFMWVYCISIGLCSMLAYLPPLMCAWESYPKNKGMVTGVIISAYGVSSSMFNFLFVMLQNPEEDKPSLINGEYQFSDEINARLPYTLQYIAIICLVLMTLGTIFCDKHNEEVGNGNTSELVNVEVKNVEMHHYTSYSFYVPFSLNVITCMTGLFIMDKFQSIGIGMNYSIKYLNYVGYIAPICNCLGRFSLSVITDKYGYKFGYTCMILTNLICTLLLQVENEYLYCFCVIMLYTIYGSHFTYAAVFYANLYEPYICSKIYSLFFLSFSIESSIYIAYSGFFEHWSNSINFYLLSGMNLFALLVLVCFNFDMNHLKKYFKKLEQQNESNNNNDNNNRKESVTSLLLNNKEIEFAK